jgi:diaminopimelate epimerase
MKMRFTKMHGLGNDFIVMNCIEQSCPPADERFGELSKRLCNRRFGIGADQILLLHPSSMADFGMKIFNADGGEVEMCGNGVRCVAKYIWDRNLSDKDVLNIETLAGIIKPEKAGDMVRVDVGEPVFEPEKIPVIPSTPPLEKGGMAGFEKKGRGGKGIQDYMCVHGKSPCRHCY